MDSLGVSVVVALLLAVLGLVHIYIQKKLNYWKDRNIPFPKPRLFFGNTLDFYNQAIHEVELERYRKHGRIYGTFEGLTPTLTIADPALLRNIYVKDFNIFPNRRKFKFDDPILDNMLTTVRDDQWKRIRSIVSPTFSASKMRKMIPLIKDCASSLLENLQDASKDGGSVDAKAFYGAFGMDLIASCAFGTKLDSHKDPDNPFVSRAQRISNQKLPFRLMIFFLFPFLLRIFRFNFIPKDIVEFFRDATFHIIEQRKAKKDKRSDFLQLLLDAQQGTLDLTEEDKVDNANQQSQLPNAPKGKTLTENEMLAQCIVFFLAGHDTVVNTLSFVTYSLAKNPEIQEKLIKEIDETWESHDGMDYDGLMKMKYLDAIINETLRRYSIAVRGERLCEQDYKLGDTGLVIPKGMIVGFPAYAMHHDPEWFPEPEKFYPERFLAENKTFPPYTFLPFGEGPRNCVGMRFAMLQMKSCIFYLLRHIRFVATEETKVEYVVGQGLLKSKHIIVKIEPRTEIN